VSVGDTDDIKKTVSTSNKSKQEFKKGDLVCTYIMNSALDVNLLQRGIVIDVNPTLEDILVVDDGGFKRWWPNKRWKLCEKED